MEKRKATRIKQATRMTGRPDHAFACAAPSIAAARDYRFARSAATAGAPSSTKWVDRMGMGMGM